MLKITSFWEQTGWRDMTESNTGYPKSPEGLTGWLRRVTRGPIERLAHAFIWLGLGPDVLTFVGLILAGLTGYLAAQGAYTRAALVYLVGAPFDAMDGAVARASGKASRFGALLDSTLDRYGEALVLTGLGYHLAREGQWTGLVLAFVTLLGSVMVSYVRARSEGLGIENKVGLLTRVERVIVMLIALFTGQVVIGLWVLAILTHVTVVQRVWHVFQATRNERG
jgi:CDP-diacylglycerol--glycerol-3-phosphate 3-phosphatidyltransferase